EALDASMEGLLASVLEDADHLLDAGDPDAGERDLDRRELRLNVRRRDGHDGRIGHGKTRVATPGRRSDLQRFFCYHSVRAAVSHPARERGQRGSGPSRRASRTQVLEET